MLPDTSWLLLIWTGLAATIFASVLVAPLAAKNTRGAIPYMRPASLGDSLLLAVLGVLVYPAIYGLILDALHTASILAGAGLGLVHALVLVLYTRINRRATDAARAIILTHIAYGAALGFLYVTP